MAKEAWPILIPVGVCAVVALGLCAAFSLPGFGYLSGVLIVGAGFIAAFFRDPERVPPPEGGAIVSAGDGKVVAVQPVLDDFWLGGEGIQVSVFLSIFDVHVNRIPFSGRVDAVEYRSGRFRPAFAHRASAENEQAIVRIRGHGFTMVVKQIAGFLARRIVCRLTRGDRVTIGQRFGLIKFGSRIDHLLPPTARVKVKVGDRVKAGETVIGVF